ncbi:dynein axonemal heavy chain 17-like isoform X2 [Gambusia affinis]|uniref:dynein axonemal heavy chain 17-like isoform X2 n=1 Tax=Gambusia affinis TaxID=33528 RepID=UPI001CDC7CBA|nr:dynein axonemal heavy chain 17-like isoform X2 [Gambusia affinis]
MEGTDDERLEPIRMLVQRSFQLDPDKWGEFVSESSNKTVLTRFMSSPDYQLFFHLQPDSGLQASLGLPSAAQAKVVCVSRAAQEGSGKAFRIHEFSRGKALSGLVGLSEEVSCPLLSRAADRSRWAVGVAQDAMKLLEKQKNAAQVVEAKVEGLTFLPPPNALYNQDDLDLFFARCSPDQGGGCHDNDNSNTSGLVQDPSPKNLSLTGSNNSDNNHHDDSVEDCSSLHDNGCHVNQNEQKLAVARLLHACEETVVEWVELVSDFLQQDWSGLVLDRQKPVPSEEFSFWKNRLKNLLFIKDQLLSSKAQQVGSILKAEDSIYWAALQDLQRHVQEGGQRCPQDTCRDTCLSVCLPVCLSTCLSVYLSVPSGVREAEDITLHLTPVQQKLSEVLEMDFHQLKDNVAAVMKAVGLLWTRSEFYCRPRRTVVLLQEICNLYIQLSRGFLPGQEVIGVLVSERGPVLQDIRLVIQTLQALKAAFYEQQTQLEVQNQNQATPPPSWTFPSHLVFFHLDTFLKRLLSIQEVHLVTARFYQLDQVVLTGASGTLLTVGIQQVYQDFLVQVRLLSACSCDPTDPKDQTFELELDRFWEQVLDLETRLVSVLSKALEDCSEVASAAKVVKMFWFFLDRPRVQDQLPPCLARLEDQVLADLDRTELEFYSQKEKPERRFRFCPAGAARLYWNRQLRRRAQETLRSFRTIQNLCGGVASAPALLQRAQQVVALLQDFRTKTRSDWSAGLEEDCSFVLKQNLVQIDPPTHLEVAGRKQLEAVLQQLRYVSREGGVALCPNADRLLQARDDITHTFLLLDQTVSCYNQVVGGAMEAELPLIQEQLQQLNDTLSELQSKTWICKGVQEQSQEVLAIHSSITEARVNMDAMRSIAQGWAELDLLQRSHDSLLESSVNDHTCRGIKADGEQLLSLTQVNRRLYRADEASEAWTGYLDYIDDQVQDGLLQLLHRALRFLTDSMNPQSGGAALLAVSLQLRDSRGLVFEPLIDDGPAAFLKTIMRDVYGTCALVPRISIGRHGDYQESLRQNPELCALEQEVMTRLLQVKEEAEKLRVGLDRYAHLWLSDKQAVFQEFLAYSKPLAVGEVEAEENPPSLKDFQREIQVLLTVSSEVTHLDEGVVLQGWLQVDMRPFITCLLSIILDWKDMYTDFLLESATNSLQQATQPKDRGSASFDLTDTILLLEAAGVELPEHLAAKLQ